MENQEGPTPNQGKLLGEALFRVLVKSGMLRKDCAPSGPLLLLAAKDFCENEPEIDFMKSTEVKPHRPKWETGLAGLVSQLEENKGSTNWGENGKLKYLEFRVDIRDCAFTVSDRFGNPVKIFEIHEAMGFSAIDDEGWVTGPAAAHKLLPLPKNGGLPK